MAWFEGAGKAPMIIKIVISTVALIAYFLLTKLGFGLIGIPIDFGDYVQIVLFGIPYNISVIDTFIIAIYIYSLYNSILDGLFNDITNLAVLALVMFFVMASPDFVGFRFAVVTIWVDLEFFTGEIEISIMFIILPFLLGYIVDLIIDIVTLLRERKNKCINETWGGFGDNWDKVEEARSEYISKGVKKSIKKSAAEIPEINTEEIQKSKTKEKRSKNKSKSSSTS